jgi:hypothetical protein
MSLLWLLLLSLLLLPLFLSLLLCFVFCCCCCAAAAFLSVSKGCHGGNCLFGQCDRQHYWAVPEQLPIRQWGR